MIAGYVLPCTVLDRQRRFRGSPSRWDYYGPVSWMSCVPCVFYIPCPRQKASYGNAKWENGFPCCWYGPVRVEILVGCVVSMLSCQRDAEEVSSCIVSCKEPMVK